MMNWDDMRVFLAVARAESLSEAGRRLRVDPATVGRRVARLEEVMGAPLFAKSPQGYALTEAGQRLMAPAEAAEQAMSAGQEALQGRSDSLSGTIRVGAPDGCANYVLPQICTQIAQANPDLEIQIVAQPRVANLTKREADMAIAVSPPTGGRVSVQKIVDYRLSLAAARQYIARNPPIREVADLKGHRVIGYIPDMIVDKELDYLHEAGLEQVNLASNSISVQFNLIRNAGGIGFVHDFALPSAPKVQKILPGTVSLSRSFYLVRHDDDRRLERMNRFAEALVAGMRAEVARLESQA